MRRTVPEHKELPSGTEPGGPDAAAPAASPRKDSSKALSAEERKQRRCDNFARVCATFLDAGSHTLPWSLPSLESNRLAAKRAYYRRLDKVSAMQLENKTLQDLCDDQKHRINVYEILVRAKPRLCCGVLATCGPRLSSPANRSACPCCSCGAWESILRLPSTQRRHSRKGGERPLALSRGLVRRSSKSRRSISSSR